MIDCKWMEQKENHIEKKTKSFQPRKITDKNTEDTKITDKNTEEIIKNQRNSLWKNMTQF